MNDAATGTWESHFSAARALTESLAAGLSEEDQCVQSMPDASPAKWHRAHTSWFFEQFLLLPFAPDYQPFDPDFAYLFNSYYDAMGPRHQRPLRGILTRPPASAVHAYRRHVDDAMRALLGEGDASVLALAELGIHHEQQHQELLLTDMLHAFSLNPLCPAVLPDFVEPRASGAPEFVTCDGGLVRIGHDGEGFSFDNEGPGHSVFLPPFRIADRLVRNADFIDFIAAGGYLTPGLWMSEGFDQVRSQEWEAPLHWRGAATGWQEMTLAGLRPLDPAAPVRHISWYEADAFARWSNARLPTEAEWETAHRLGVLRQAQGYVWQWTDSAYRPYPGFHPARGAVGEYNGKFMINQMVLRGSSLATPSGHARLTYRNFFHPDKRWQFSGLRLARDV